MSSAILHATVVPGRWDNLKNFSQHLVEDQFFVTPYITRALEKMEFELTGSDANSLLGAYVLAMARFKSTGRKPIIGEVNVLKAVMIVETLGPQVALPEMVTDATEYVLDEKFVIPTTETDEALLDRVTNYICEWYKLLEVDAKEAKFDVDAYLRRYETIFYPEDARAKLGPDEQIADEDKVMFTWKEIKVMMEYLMKSQVEAKLCPTHTEMLVVCIISACRRGHLTEKCAIKLNSGILSDTGKNITIEPALIAMLFPHLTKSLGPKGVRLIFQRWMKQLPVTAIRLRTVIDQSIGAGLTGFDCVARAFSNFPDFPWYKLLVINKYQVEFTAFWAAWKVIGQDGYMGFQATNSLTKATLYPNLIWVAKTLLIKLNNDTSLKEFKGFVKTPFAAEAVQKVMDTYTENYESDQVQKMDNAIKPEGYDDLFKEFIKLRAEKPLH